MLDVLFRLLYKNTSCQAEFIAVQREVRSQWFTALDSVAAGLGLTDESHVVVSLFLWRFRAHSV